MENFANIVEPEPKANCDDCASPISSSDSSDEATTPIANVEDSGILKQPMKSRQLRRQRIHTVHCYIARTTVSAVAASAAMFEFSGEVIQDDADGSMTGTDSLFSFFISLVSRFISHMQDSIYKLGDMIGRPPRDPFSEDTPPALLWAVDIGLVCVAMAILCGIAAFAAGAPQADPDPASFKETSDELPPDSIGDRLWYRTRVVIVMVLSALGGGLLNVKHSVHSALFLGM